MKIFLTKSSTFLIGWIALVLGVLMDGIFYGISAINIPNVGFAIILFTIIIYVAMTPLQIKQQRFSKLTAVMQPELSRIQEKYKGKKDQESQQRQMDETQAVYRKYGVSATGSCVQLLIQMPVLFALYEVIYKIPGYITLIGNRLTDMVNTSGFSSFFNTFVTGLNDRTLTQAMTTSPQTANYVDTLYKLNSTQWTTLLSSAQGQSFSSKLNETYTYIDRVTNFLGLNISDSPMTIFTDAWKTKLFLMMGVALLFPVLAWFTQWLNFKLMPQTPQKDGEQNTMQNTMKSMNTFMPVVSAVFCFTLPVGVGIYWIAGAVVRSIQQWIINAKLDKEDMDEVIKKNQEKAAKKLEKKGVSRAEIARAAAISTRSLDVDKQAQQKKADLNARLKKVDQMEDAEETSSYADGSLASKANMVARFDEKNNKNKNSNMKKK